MIRHFTASAVILDSRKRVLMMWHKKYGMWMTMGGHMDENEIPEEAAARECKEETGIDVEIVHKPGVDYFKSDPTTGRMLTPPYALLLENVPENINKGEPAHQHIDFIYLAKPMDERQALQVHEREGSELEWFTKHDIEAIPEGKIFKNLRELLLTLV